MIPTIDPQSFVDRQLALNGPELVTFSDGQTCTLTSGKVIPLATSGMICLDGAWDLRQGLLLDQVDGIIQEDSTGWEQVVQPGVVCIADRERQPKDIPNWHRRFMRHIDEQEVAILKKKVLIPADWAGRSLHLRLEGVYPAADIYVGGELLAEHRSGLTPCSVPCDAVAQAGSEVEVTVVIRRRYPQQEIDMPRHTSDYAGMHGSVHLIGLPSRYVMEQNLRTSLDAEGGVGHLAGRIVFGGQRAGGQLQIRVTAPDGSPVIDTGLEVSSEDDGIDLEEAVPAPELWCDETPHCYQVELEWKCGAITQTLAWTSGFRHIAVIDGRPTINGQPLKVRAVNHLTTHPEHGLYMPKAWLRQSLELMKKANVNAIRTHLTGPTALAELCDEMGFYLIQEIMTDWYGHELGHPRALGPCLQRIDGVLRRDRHHVSLLAVGIGNENLAGNREEISSFAANYRVFYDFAKALSPETWVMFPPPGPANAIPGSIEPRIGDVADVHYNFATVRELNETGSVTLPESWKGPFTSYSREELLEGDWQGIWFSSEYGIVNAVPEVHDAPYQSVICEQSEDWLGSVSSTQALANRLEREWGLMRDDPSCLGGAYFPWLPPGTGDTWGWTFWAEDADWGVVTRDLTPKPQFWVLRAAYSPITFAERRVVWTAGQNEIRLRVRNRYSTIDLRDCTLRSQLGATGKFMGILQDWKDLPAQCPPGADSELTIPLWHEGARTSLEAGKPAVLRLHVIAPDGFRPITHDVLIVPELLAARIEEGHISLGSDA